LLKINTKIVKYISRKEGIKNEEGRMENEEQNSSPSLPLEGGD